LLAKRYGKVVRKLARHTALISCYDIILLNSPGGSTLHRVRFAVPGALVYKVLLLFIIFEQIK